MTTRLYTISEAAAALGVHVQTLRKWVDDGNVLATILPSGYRRFSQQQLDRIKADIGLVRKPVTPLLPDPDDDSACYTPAMSDYDAIYGQDHPTADAPHGRAWVQWKGTDVSMDTYCACGWRGHVDATFCYALQCPACGAVYAVGQNIKLIRLTDTQAREARTLPGLHSLDPDYDPADSRVPAHARLSPKVVCNEEG